MEKYHGNKTHEMFWAWASTWTTSEDDEYRTLKQVENITTQTNGKSTPFVNPNVRHTPHKEVPEPILQKASVDNIYH